MKSSAFSTRSPASRSFRRKSSAALPASYAVPLRMNSASRSCSTAAMRCSILRASTGQGAAVAVPIKRTSAKIDTGECTGSGLHVGVELGRREAPVEVAEAPLSLHLARRVDEPAHRGAVERRGEAHAPHARGLELADREGLALDAGH